MKIFSIYDTTSEIYENPITVKTTAEMERALQNLAQTDKDHKLMKYHSEHILFEIGTFDPSTCETIIYPEKKSIATLTKYIQ